MSPAKARPRKARGAERPAYLDGADVDKVMTIVLALMSEVAALRDRVDTHERLGTEGMLPALRTVEEYEIDDAVEAERVAWRKSFINRLLRVVTEELEERSEAAPEEQSR